MIEDLLLRWVVTLLFGLAIVECLFSFWSHRMPWYGQVGHVLHVIMSAAMLVMAWPFSLSWATVPPMVFFLLSAVWFLVASVAWAHTWTERAADLYHVVMMSAMAWMYAVMNATILPGHTQSGDMEMGHDGAHGSGMAGMDMGHAGTGDAMTAHAGAEPGYVEPINVALGIGFVLAAVVWLYVYFSRRQAAEHPSSLLTHPGEICQVLMAAGMSIMFFDMV